MAPPRGSKARIAPMSGPMKRLPVTQLIESFGEGAPI